MLVAFLKNTVFSTLCCDLGKEATSEKHGVGTMADPLQDPPRTGSQNQLSMCFLRKDTTTENTTFSEFRDDFAVLEGRARALIHKPKTNILGIVQEEI